ncbi:MAG: hypothetical protein HY319_27710 [Armatimonadetes bacterium]|nr:hypothetical protein [Armatimonadota bacterium]
MNQSLEEVFGQGIVPLLRSGSGVSGVTPSRAHPTAIQVRGNAGNNRFDVTGTPDDDQFRVEATPGRDRIELDGEAGTDRVTFVPNGQDCRFTDSEGRELYQHGSGGTEVRIKSIEDLHIEDGGRSTR